VEINNIIFYNFEKNGDCFVNKGYVKEIMQHLHDVSFSYVHDRHESIIADLDCRFIRSNQIPREIDSSKKCILHEDSGTLFMNTWIGAWIGTFLVHGQHANFPLLHKAWSEYLKILDIPIKEDFFEYAPEIDYSRFDLSQADSYLQKVNGKPLVVICNGIQQSGQSSMGTMEKAIGYIAQKFSDHEFAVTYKLKNLNLPNITYTDDLFNGSEGHMNQISYIARQAKLIVGKNSGPFTFCHTKEMMSDPNKTFLTFNHRLTDALMGDGEYYANSFFSHTVDNNVAAQIIEHLLTNNDFISTEKKPTRHINVE